MGLARWAAGQADGEALCREACEAFERVVASAEARKNDAQFYLDQLRHVQGQYVSA